VTGLASSNEGGMGMPGAPQPERSAVARTQKTKIEWAGRMETTGYQKPRTNRRRVLGDQLLDGLAEHASVLVNVILVGGRRHQGHIVKRCE
jgi:hypothetical protein